MMIELTPRRFYITGIICFLVIGIFNSINYITYFNQVNLYSKIASLFGIVFNFALALFFKYLLSQDPAQISIMQGGDIDEVIEDLRK